MALRVLAFEPYDGGSHRAMRESVVRHSRHAWRWLVRPPGAWKWRMRTAALELAALADREAEGPFDAVFATSLMSLADLRAALPPRLLAPQAPFLLYMHENQAAYPVAEAAPEIARRDVQFALTNLASAWCADRVLWNSAWNRDSFLDALATILVHHPDAALGDWRTRLLARSVVAWPPVEPPPAPVLHNRPRPGADPAGAPRGVRVAWPHRWEHDKGPEELLEVAERWTVPLGLRWTILGIERSPIPAALAAFRRRFADAIDHFGHVADRDAYQARLAGCDWVLSTARHEYFGIAVAEALMAGCLPWLPARLSYRELLPPNVAGVVGPHAPPADEASLRAAIAAHLAPARADRAVARIDDELDAARAASLKPPRPQVP